ncbi:KdsC family phosphatase [Pedobacter rhizosphaerae]|uniref:3-deoxy-D-manno-octulosonate 8-phosphate phosphatase (KDO 8-P phosphatase) n=1 Tax=Pedobacter rhizosphaerae TaxID=390241 RepID=A0A1H9MW17_9SPHI|nr:HAD-IIIA family hydrolase [Pedobacter rhizosphaerae]SER27882.1 3-deoxy-D-manno-octulosonate 8-phosphate phosphatase (KDO 8-P phosphatase) [Pedobacter rhizosphaerae]
MFLQKLKDITTFIFDVDGVLTDGSVQVTDSGQSLRTFNIKDGYAMQLAVKKGYNLCIISGGDGIAMAKRFSNLGITDVFLAAGDKVALFQKYLTDRNITADEVLYMGDDIPDLKVMKLVGLPTCPADAVEEIKAISTFISPYNGGKTAVRDIIEKVMKVQGRWNDDNPQAVDSGK